MFTTEMLVPDSSRRLSSIDECRPELRKLHDLWSRLRGERRMPSRAEFDPADARSVLRHLMLIDVFADAPPERRFRVRLHGTAQADYLGTDWTGYFIHERTDRAAADRLCAVGDHVVASRTPWMSTGQVYFTAKRPLSHFESVLLPLSDDDDVVNVILGLTIFFRR